MPKTNSASVSDSSTSGSSTRLLSLDALRGFDMLWIVGAEGFIHALDKMSDTGLVRVLANQLRHKPWEGFAFYDLIFPLFVFIVGVSIVFSLGKLVSQEGALAAYKRILRRSILLFVIGLLYSGGASNEWPNIRILGVLNRIALCYLFAGLIFCHFKARGIITISAALLIGYWAMMSFVPVPGIGAGSFTPGANLANYVDKIYLPGRRYDGDWDPEGLISTMPAIVTCLLGVLAGFLLKNDSIAPARKVVWLVGGGIVGVTLGFLWGFQFPVIKKIWTSSYVLVAGGYSCILLGLFYWIVDVLKFQKWTTPFVWIGMNPITIYLLDNVVNFERFAGRFAGGDIKRFFDAAVTKGFGDLVVQITGLGICLLIARFLYQRKVFIRL